MLKMILQKLLRKEPVIKSGRSLINVRLVLFGTAWVHLIVAAIIIVPADMSIDDDPKVRVYQRLKWRFITAWFNFINLAYLPICLYCDWKEKKGEENAQVMSSLRRVRDVIFTGILFPVIVYSDVTFWYLYFIDPTLISPIRLFDYMPSWGQHSLHTVSLIVVLLDLFLVPRKKPRSLKPRFILLTSFFAIYCLVVLDSYSHGEAVYCILEVISEFEVYLLILVFYLEHILFYFLQWIIIDFVWKQRSSNRKIS